MSRGKSWERELKQCFERAGYLCYRNVDAMTGKGKGSVKSLPDLWAFSKQGRTRLVEAKVVKGKSLPFDRLAEHQHDHLFAFARFSPSHQGLVAVMFYGEKPRWKRAFLLRIDQWEWAEDHLDRRSLPLDHAEKVGIELTWIPSVGWQLPKGDK